jgi:hypothetical protein
MVTIKQAAATAHQYLSELLGLTAGQQVGVQLEEIDSTEAEWLITLSIPDRSGARIPFTASNPREYKVLAVDKVSGEVKSMKIRSVQNA